VEGFQEFEENIFKYATARTIIYWMVFALLTGACISVFLAEGTLKKKNVDCLLSNSWSEWIGCENFDCNANAYRSRSVLNEAVGDGLPCAQQDLLQTATCKTIIPQCAAMNCQYSNWSVWSTCPDSCIRTPNDCSTIPNQMRSRNVIRTSLPGGDPCDWTSLVQTQQCPVPPFCSLSKQCEPRPPAADFSQCHPCPEIACTVTGSPIYTMCTMTNAKGPDTDCEPGQLLYSRTCVFADCTTQCENNNYSYFSRCSEPCGPGSFMSTTGLDCPNVTITDCNLMTCSTGGMVLTTSAFGSTTPTFYQVCSASDVAPDFLSSTRCLARCSSSQTCNYAWQSATNANVTLSSDLPAAGTFISKFWSYNSGAPCVTPNWDMVGASCLYLCENSGNQQFSLFANNLGGPYDAVRGIVFPFDNGSMSCPLTPDLLSILCPTENNKEDLLGDSLNLSLIGGVGVIPGMMANYTFTDKFSDIGSHRFICPISKDCEYQSWTDARAWGPCSQETNANDQGTRSRNRTIVAQQQFLGDPCNVEEMIEYSFCNRSLTLNSSTDMWCPLYAGDSNVVKSVSEYACHKICSDMRAMHGPDACNSMQIYSENPVGGRAPEVFLVRFPSLVNSDSVTTQSKLGLPSSPSSFAVATRAQLEGAWSSGMQSCLPGWFLVGDSQSAQATSVQAGCGSIAPNSLSIFPGNADIQQVWMFGKKNDLYNLSITGLLLYDFYTPTTATSPFDPYYSFTNQTFQSDQTCAFFTDRTDILVGDCTSLSARPGVSRANLLDVPYSFAQNCSLTDWVTIHDCSETCALISAQTRSIVNTFSSEGGLPCSRVATYRYKDCGSSFSCPQTFSDVCILPVLPSLPDYVSGNSCTDALFTPDVFLEHYSQSYIYEWSVFLSNSQQLSVGIGQFFSSTVRVNALGGALSIKVQDALNSQCGYTNGDTSCLSLSDGSYLLNYTNTSTPLGWIKLEPGQTCSTNSALQSCLFGSSPGTGRLALPHTEGKMYYDLSLAAWQCPSTCRPGGLSFSCAMGTPPLDKCACTPPYFNPPIPPDQTLAILYSSYTSFSNQTNAYKLLYSCNLPDFLFKFGCSSSSLCEQIPCTPPGNDGSACNAASGLGECDTDFGTCTCIHPPPTLSKVSCNSGCALGPNGLPCSGEGTCTYQPLPLDDFFCQCNPGRSGEVCEIAGTGLVGLLENLLYQGSALITEYGALPPLPTSSTKTFSFYNPEPRCEFQQAYCAGAQLFTQGGVYHAFYPVQSQVSYGPRGVDGKLVPQDYANICVNSLDSSFNSDFIPSNYLISPLTSYSVQNGNTPIDCQQFRDREGNQAYKYKARFTSNSNIPFPLQNKLFYTRCPEPTLYNIGTYSYKFLPINQFDSSGNLLFNLLEFTKSLLDLCPS